jgi:hypothetical protein
MQQIPKDPSTRSPWLVWAKRLLQLYPACWRERYADEMLAILEEHPPTFWTFTDLLLSLCDAHLHGDLVSGKIVGRVKQFYGSVTVIVSAGLLFCLIAFATTNFLTDISTHLSSQAGSLPPFFQPMLLMLSSLSFLLVILLVFCVASLLLSIGWQALKTRQILSFFLYLFGILSPVIAYVAHAYVTFIAIFYFPFLLNLSLQFWLILFSIFAKLVFLLIVGAGFWALRVALRRVVPGVRLTNLLFVSATLISAILCAFSSSLLFLMVYSFFSGLGTEMAILATGPVRVFLPVSAVFALYSLVRAHQARRILTVHAR